MLTKEDVLLIIADNKFNYWRVMKYKHNSFYVYVNSNIIGDNFGEKLYKWLNPNETGKCLQCGNSCKFNDIFTGYRKYCSYKCTNNSLEVKDKKERSYIKKYNVSNPSKSEKIKQLKKETFLSHYGEDCNLKTEETKECIKRTNLLKYGTEYPIQAYYVKKAIMDRNYFRFFYDGRYKNVIPKFTKYEYKGVEFTYKWKCKLCNMEFDDHLQDGRIPRCYKCFPQCISIAQTQIVDYIKTIIPDDGLVINDRKVLDGLELDIYIPARKLAIEFDGLYYHSNIIGGKDINYHLMKTLQCERLGIQLLHIFENEWLHKTDNIKDTIKHSILKSPIDINNQFGIKPIVNGVETDRRFFFKNSNFSRELKIVEYLPPKKHFLDKYYSNIIQSVSDDWVWDCGYIVYSFIN